MEQWPGPASIMVITLAFRTGGARFDFWQQPFSFDYKFSFMYMDCVIENPTKKSGQHHLAKEDEYHKVSLGE